MNNFPFVCACVLSVLFTFTSSAESLRWRDASDLTIEGKGWSDTKDFYDRYPARAEKTVRPIIWKLSHDSAGMCVRFVSDAPEIHVRWVLRDKNIAMPHMSATGVSGVDLYLKDRGRWHWVGGGRPTLFPTNEMAVVKNLDPGTHEFALYLPLYNGVKKVEIGVADDAKLEPAPVRNVKPILFYGTSILQGACASRPGMAYPSILGRRLDWPTMNFGFSGNALSEPEVAKLLAEQDPAVYVIDPVPNMPADLIKQRVVPFIKTLRAAHPKTPIIMIESLAYTDGDYVAPRRERYSSSNKAMRAAYDELKKTEKNLSYIPSERLIGQDGEATVDGTHPNDAGFMRMVDAVEPVLRKALPRR